MRLGEHWSNRLISSLVKSGKSISYLETINPHQSDTFHKEIKKSDILLFKRYFEKSVRSALKKLRLKKVKVAIDVTEDPYWGKNGFYNTRAKVHVKSKESWQYVNLSIVEPYFLPLMSLPYRQIDNLDDLVFELIEYLKSLNLKVDVVLFDRGFYHWNLIRYLNKEKIPYLILVPSNKRNKKLIKETKNIIGVYDYESKYNRDKSTFKVRTKIVIIKSSNNSFYWIFATNLKPSRFLVCKYRKRWNIETGFRIHDEVRIKSKSSNNMIRFYYHLLGMLIIIMWRIKSRITKKIIPFKRFLIELEKEIIMKYLLRKPPPLLEEIVSIILGEGGSLSRDKFKRLLKL